jgi:hypothetical protein
METYLGMCGLRKTSITSAGTANVRDLDVNSPFDQCPANKIYTVKEVCIFTSFHV